MCATRPPLIFTWNSLTPEYSIPTRRELVKEAARNPTTTELKESQQEQQEYYWSNDPISNKPLARPVVSDSTGKLYNKDTILEYLIPSEDEHKKAEAERVLMDNVKNLKDVVEVKFEIEEHDKPDRNTVGRTERWICPITNKLLGSGSKAVYLVPCGHAFSASVVKEVADEKCLQCNEPYAPNDIIPIIPVEETDVARLLLRIKDLKSRGLTHSLKSASKSSKKRKKNAEAEGEKENGEQKDRKKPPPTNPNIKNASTASLTAKVLEEQEERNKKRKMAKNDNLDSLFSNRDQTKPHGKSSDFMTRGFSIQAP